jgi:hypothetical protein
MKAITLEYNPRNKTAGRIIDLILAMDVFKVREREPAGAELTRRAMEEVKRGDVIHCGSYEDYLKKTGGNA